MAGEKEVIEEIAQVEEGDECHHIDPKDWLFVLLLRVTQANGRPLPIRGFTSRAMTQMIHDIMGVIPKEVDILTDQEVVFKIEDQSSIIEVSRVIQGLFHWGGQSIMVDSVVATQDLITKITKEWEVEREKQKELEWEQWWLRENQQECQQQMIEILEKVSEQAKKVENIHSGSMPALDGEYYTSPVSQVKVNWVTKLNAPPNLPIFSGQGPVLSTEGSIDQWLFQVEGALAMHTKEAVRSTVIGSVRGAAHELLGFIGYGEEMSDILKHIKVEIWTGTFQSYVA